MEQALVDLQGVHRLGRPEFRTLLDRKAMPLLLSAEFQRPDCEPRTPLIGGVYCAPRTTDPGRMACSCSEEPGAPSDYSDSNPGS